MSNTNKFKNHALLAFSFLVAIVVLTIPFFIRYSNGDPIFAGRDFYYDLRASNDLSEGIYWDSLEDELHKISFSHYLLSLFASSSMQVYLPLVSVFVAIMSVFLFFLILKQFFKDKQEVFISTFLFVLSPIFLYLFTRLNSYSLATLFSLCFIYLFVKENYLSVPFLVLVSITDFSFFLINIFLAIHSYFSNRKKRLFLINMFFSVISFIIFSFFHEEFPFFKTLFSKPSFNIFFTSFGAEVGIAFFYLFLGLIGFLSVWKRKRKFFNLLFSVIIIFFFAFFNIAGRVFLNFYLCVFSGLLISFFINRMWAINILKRFTILLIFCSIIFTTVLYTDQLIKSEPQEELVYVLNYLSFEPRGVVLSHQKHGHHIEYFSSKKSFLDDGSINRKDYSLLKDVEQEIFYSRNLEFTKSLLNKNLITYILITPEMKNGLVWSRDEEGMLFLLENSDYFSKIFSVKNVELWRFSMNINNPSQNQ